jgi:hypothetical protein
LAVNPNQKTVRMASDRNHNIAGILPDGRLHKSLKFLIFLPITAMSKNINHQENSDGNQ